MPRNEFLWTMNHFNFIFLSDYRFDRIFLDSNEAFDFIPHILINKI